MGCIEVGDREARDLAGAAQPVELERCLHVTWDLEVPPVELYEIDALHTQPAQRPVDDPFHVAAVHRGQIGEVRYELGVNLHLLRQRGVRAAEVADQLLDTHVDVGAIECSDAGLDEADHVLDGLLRIDAAMIASEMPSALDEPRDRVTLNERVAGNHFSCGSLPCSGRGTAVVSDRLK